MTASYDENNIFAKILRGEAPCIKIYEDDLTLSFMDVMPQLDGHVLVIPKESATTVFELSDEAALACMRTVKKVGPAVQKAMGAKGITTFQLNGSGVGQTVPHYHIHILPGSLFGMKGLKGHAAEFADQNLLKEFASKIIACLD